MGLVDHVNHVIMEAGDLLQDLDGASTVGLMATGLGIAKLVTGRTSVTAVESGAMLKEIARIVQRNSNVAGVTQGHHLLVLAVAVVLAGVAATAVLDHLRGGTVP